MLWIFLAGKEYRHELLILFAVRLYLRKIDKSHRHIAKDWHSATTYCGSYYKRPWMSDKIYPWDKKGCPRCLALCGK